MAKLTTRTLTTTTVTSDNKPKGSALTHNDLDSNFLNLETDKLENTSDDFTGTLSVKGSGASAVGVIRHYDNDDSNYIDIQAPGTVATNYALTLPTTAGTSGQVLTTDGSGTLTWTAKTVDTDTDTGILNVVEDTTPQLGGDLDTQAFSIGGTDIIPSADYAEGTSTQTGKGTRLTGTASDFGIRTIQSSGKQNIMLMADLDGSHSAGLDKTGLVYAPLNIQVRDRGESTKTRTTFDIQVPYVSQTGTSITSSSGGTANILDVNTDDNVVFVENIAGTFATSDTMSAGPITGTITAIQDLSSNAKALYYSGGITGSTAQSDLADLGFARISTKTGMNNEGGLGGRSAPNLDLEAGTITMDISTGQTLSPFGGILSDASNMVEIKGGRYASGLRIYDASVGDGTQSGFQLDPFHFDKYLGSDQKKGGQFSIQLFGEGLPKESYGSFGETDALGVHQKFEIKDNSDYYIGTVNTVSGDATVTDHGGSLFANADAGDWIRIEGAVSDSNGNAMSGNLNCTISSVAGDNSTIEIDVPASAGSGKVLSDIITGTARNATIIKNSSTAIRMSAGTTGATHTFTHKSQQDGTNVDGNDRVNLEFQAKKITFQAGTDSDNVDALEAETSLVAVKPKVPTSTGGPGFQFGWNSNTTGGAAHIKSALSVDATSDTAQTQLLFNEGIQISAASAGDGSTNGGYDSDFSWATLAFKQQDKHGSLTSPNTDRNTLNQAYGNIWFVKENRDATNTTQAAVESNQILGGFFSAGSKDNSSLSPTSASMFMRATEDFSGSANGTRIEFSATKNGDTSTTPCLDINGDSVVINEESNDVDFRVESNGEANAIKVDAGTDTVSLETIIVMMPNLPTSDPSNTGQLWNDGGTLKISS